MKLILKATILSFLISTSSYAQIEDCQDQTQGYNMLLIGNSFFRPYAEKLDELAIDAGFENHTSTQITRGGENGRPINFWNDSSSPEHDQIKSTLDQGNVDFFGMTAGHDPEDPIEGHRAWIDYALQSNPGITIFIAIPQIDFPADWDQRAEEYGFDNIHELYDFFVNDLVHDTMVNQLRIEFPTTKIFTIPTGQASVTLDQMNIDNELLDDITRFGPQETSLFTDTKGHQGDIIREAGSLLWLNSIYGVDLSTFDYDTGFNTDLHAVAKDIMDAHDPDYKLCFVQDCLQDTTNLDIELSWDQEPNGWTYESFIKIPDGATPQDVYPVCIALHGNGGNGEFMRNNIGNLLDCHIVVAPSGYSNSWNICGEQSDAPDVEFVNLLIDELLKYKNVDPDNIKILGSSNGAALTNRMFIENDMPNISQFVAMVSQMTDPQFHDGNFHSPSGETNNQSDFCGYDVVNSIVNNREYLSICNINDGVIPYEGGTSVGTSFIPAEESIFEIAKSQGYTGTQISTGVQIDNSEVFEFSYLDDKVVLLNGMAGHTTNTTQRDYIKEFMNDCVIVQSEPEVKCDSTYAVIIESDITYAEGLAHDGTSPTTFAIPLELDVYVPDNDSENRPVYMFIHGGGFNGGSKTANHILAMADYFASRGWVFVSINYRTSQNIGTIHTGIVPPEWEAAANQSPIPEEIPRALAIYAAQRDAKAAMRWIVANAHTYKINTDYITVGGGSAGAISAVTLGVSALEDFRDEISIVDDPTLSTTNLDESYEIQSIVDFWGSNVALEFHESVFGNHHFDSNDPPLFIAHGTEDPTVLFSEAEELVHLYDSTGVHFELNSLEGEGHGPWGATLDGNGLFKLSHEFLVEQQGLFVAEECEEENNDFDFCTSDNRFTEVEYFAEDEIEADLDVVYATNVMDWQGNLQDLAMDVFYPSIDIDPLEKRPFILLIHGGAFQFGSKESIRIMCEEFAHRGYVAATMQYRLGWDTSVPIDQVSAVYRANQDAHAAMRYISANASSFKIDTSAMFIGGGSAGAITALNVTYIDQQEWNIGFPQLEPQLGPLTTSGNNLTNSFSLKGVFNNWGSNRANTMQPDEMVPSIAFHGALDNTVPIDEGSFGAFGSRALHELYLDNGICSEITVDPQGGHGIYIDEAGTEFRVARASCFFKSIFCENCSSSYMEEQVLADCSLNVPIDNDGDGFFAEDDCDDNNPNVNPDAIEIAYNGIDDDCDPVTLDDDLDQDGFNLVDDCDDNNAMINSAQAEIVYNGIDDDCDPLTLDDDLDQDGFNLVDDCDDNNAAINPSATDIPDNGIDEDCDGIDATNIVDEDGDGFYNTIDCDDNNPNINPDQTEIPYNGQDDDCNTETLDDDLDQDGFDLADDCDDTNAMINSAQAEIVYNGIDDDCDPLTLDDDLDQDGFNLVDDCDDNNAMINSAQAELVYNGIDDDCDPLTLDDDLDQDGFDLIDDCDDENPNINPDAMEIVNNGIDEDCDGMDLVSSIHEISKATINIFPNPASNVINLEVAGKLDFVATLYDINGRIMGSVINDAQFKTATLLDGIYLLVIKDVHSGKRIVERIVVKK